MSFKPFPPQTYSTFQCSGIKLVQPLARVGSPTYNTTATSMRRLQANPANTTFKALGFYVYVHVWEPPLLPAGMSTKPAQVRWQLVLMQLAIMLDNFNHIPGVTNPMVRILFDHQGKKLVINAARQQPTGSFVLVFLHSNKPWRHAQPFNIGPVVSKVMRDVCKTATKPTTHMPVPPPIKWKSQHAKPRLQVGDGTFGCADNRFPNRSFPVLFTELHLPAFRHWQIKGTCGQVKQRSIRQVLDKPVCDSNNRCKSYVAVGQLAQKTQSNGQEEGHNFAPRTRVCLANKNGKRLWAQQLAIVFSFSSFLEGYAGEATGHMPLVHEHVWDNWVVSAEQTRSQWLRIQDMLPSKPSAVLWTSHDSEHIALVSQR